MKKSSEPIVIDVSEMTPAVRELINAGRAVIASARAARSAAAHDAERKSS